MQKTIHLKTTADSILDYLVKLRSKESIRLGEPLLIPSIDYAINNWNTVNRDRAIEILVEQEKKLQRLGLHNPHYQNLFRNINTLLVNLRTVYLN